MFYLPAILLIIDNTPPLWSYPLQLSIGKATRWTRSRRIYIGYVSRRWRRWFLFNSLFFFQFIRWTTEEALMRSNLITGRSCESNKSCCESLKKGVRVKCNLVIGGDGMKTLWDKMEVKSRGVKWCAQRQHRTSSGNLFHRYPSFSRSFLLSGVEGVVWEMVSTATDKDKWRRTLLQGHFPRSFHVPKPVLFCCDHWWRKDWQVSVCLSPPPRYVVHIVYWWFGFRFCLEAAFKMHTTPLYYPTVFDTYVIVFFSFRPSCSSLHKIAMRQWELKATRNMDYFCKHLRFFNAPLSLAPF